jgi:hypothetical protein
MDYSGKSVRDGKTVEKSVRIEGSWFIVMLAGVPSGTLSHLRGGCL